MRTMSKNTEIVLRGKNVIHISQSAKNMVGSVNFEKWRDLLGKICGDSDLIDLHMLCYA